LYVQIVARFSLHLLLMCNKAKYHQLWLFHTS